MRESSCACMVSSCHKDKNKDSTLVMGTNGSECLETCKPTGARAPGTHTEPTHGHDGMARAAFLYVKMSGFRLVLSLFTLMKEEGFSSPFLSKLSPHDKTLKFGS